MTGPRIPESQPPVGYFAALDRTRVEDTSPFDSGRTPCAQGGEDRWSARWLMSQMGYARWEDFARVVERAKVAAHNEGFNVNVLFRVIRSTPKNTGGRPQTDYLMTRYAAYLTAMSGDSRKPECAAALHYFAVKTREAEVRPAVDLTDDQILQRAMNILNSRVEALTARVAELEPAAVAWEQLAEIGGDYEVADAAKILCRSTGILIGRERLFAYLKEIGWVFRGRRNRWEAYQEQVDNGRLKHRPGAKYVRRDSGKYREGDATIVVTAKGIAELRKRLTAKSTPQLSVV